MGRAADREETGGAREGTGEGGWGGASHHDGVICRVKHRDVSHDRVGRQFRDVDQPLHTGIDTIR